VCRLPWPLSLAKACKLHIITNRPCGSNCYSRNPGPCLTFLRVRIDVFSQVCNELSRGLCDDGDLKSLSRHMVARVASPRDPRNDAHPESAAPACVLCLGLLVSAGADHAELGSKDVTGTILGIVGGSPAAFAGQLAIGDVICEVDCAKATSFAHLLAMLEGAAGTLVRLMVREVGGGSGRTAVHLMRQAPGAQCQLPAAETGVVGLVLEAAANGMTIAAIQPGSPAHMSELQVGDVVLRFEDYATGELKTLDSHDHTQDGCAFSRVLITLLRGSQRLDVKLVRTASLTIETQQAVHNYREEVRVLETLLSEGRSLDRQSVRPLHPTKALMQTLTLDTTRHVEGGKTDAVRRRTSKESEPTADLMEQMSTLVEGQAAIITCMISTQSAKDAPTAEAQEATAGEEQEIPVGITVHCDVRTTDSDVPSSVIIDSLCTMLGCTSERFAYIDGCRMGTKARHWVDILPSISGRRCRDLAASLQEQQEDLAGIIKKVECWVPVSQQVETVLALNTARSLLHSPQLTPTKVPFSPSKRYEDPCQATAVPRALSSSTFSDDKCPMTPMSPCWWGYQPSSPLACSGTIETGALRSPQMCKLARDDGRNVSGNSLRALYEALDTDGDGCLSLHEFVYGMQRHGDLVVALSRDLSLSPEEGDSTGSSRCTPIRGTMRGRAMAAFASDDVHNNVCTTEVSMEADHSPAHAGSGLEF